MSVCVYSNSLDQCLEYIQLISTIEVLGKRTSSDPRKMIGVIGSIIKK